MPQYFAEHALRLLSLGFEPIPIKPGSKAPDISGWSQMELTKELISTWAGNGRAGHGVGVRTGTVCAVDIDITDKDAVKRVVFWCEQHLGPAHRKQGQAPKVTLLYRRHTPGAKLTSARYTDQYGATHQVEVLGTGQQTVMYHTHPGTGKAYKHSANALPPVSELPMVTDDELRQLLAFVDELAQELCWDMDRPGSDGHDTRDHNPNWDEDERALASLKPRLDLTDEEVAQYLSHLDPENYDYHQWIEIGMSVHHQYAGSDDGYPLWGDWSSRWHKHDEDYTRRKWESFDTEPVRNLRTFASVIHQANQAHAKVEAPRVLQQVNPEAQGLQRVDLDGLMDAKLDPPRFVIDPWIPRGEVTLMGGHGGMGKSYVALVLAAHVACGQPFAGMEVEQGRVVFVSLEDPDTRLLYRLRCVVEEYGLDPDLVMANLVVLDGTKGFSALVQENHRGTELLKTKALDEVRETTQGATLTVIDNASDAFDANENVRRLVRGFMRELAELARGGDGGVLLLAHVDKSAAKDGAKGNSYSGSTAWHNSARSRLALIERERGVDGLHVVHEKANLSRLADPVPMLFGPHGVPLIDTLAVQRGEGGLDDEGKQAIVEAVGYAIHNGIEVYGKTEAGGSSAHTSLAQIPGYPEWLQGRQGSKTAARLMVELLGEKKLFRVDVRKNGQDRPRLTTVEPVGVDQ